MSQFPPQVPGALGMRPHRGVMVLVLGILGIVLCFICGIVAWVMGNNDLRDMDAGRMDPTGRQLTQAGKICGMIGTILAIIVLGLQIVFMILGVSLFAGAAAAGAAGGNP